jgi:hypothetical protein
MKALEFLTLLYETSYFCQNEHFISIFIHTFRCLLAQTPQSYKYSEVKVFVNHQFHSIISTIDIID